MHNKKAQASEGVTWIAATLSIIVILLISVFVTSYFASKNKEVPPGFFSPNINQKSFLSWLLTEDAEKENVYSSIKTKGNLDNYNGNLAVKIFKGMYEKEYLEIWVGASTLGEGLLDDSLNGIENEFFGKKPSSFASGAMGAAVVKDYISLKVKTDDKKFVEAIFSRK